VRRPVDLAGATSVVTGGGSGIGRATALLLAKRGSQVAVLDVDLAAAEQTAATASARSGAKARAYLCDVAEAGAVAAVAEDVEQDLGPVAVLVNNAGVGMSGHFLDTTVEDWEWIRRVNLDGVIACCHAFGPRMLERGHGHVVNVSSGLGYTPRATESAYVATKAAVLALSQCLRADWQAGGIGVSAVCPGVINTPIVSSTRYRGDRNDPEHQRRLHRIFGHGHSPEKVAAAIVRAVERDRPVVPVGIESHLGWWFHRFAPVRLQQRLARLAI
jgi:short-subunit dehydrogenase